MISKKEKFLIPVGKAGGLEEGTTEGFVQRTGNGLEDNHAVSGRMGDGGTGLKPREPDSPTSATCKHFL